MFGHDDNQDNQQPDDTTMADSPVVEPSDDNTTSAPISNDEPTTTEPEEHEEETTSKSTDTGDDLLSIKQQALEQLSPLVGHLNQSPEERFKTTMMMIQASDNQGLIKDAYEAAKEIGDEKLRAQALLDIVNEINYFTQPKN